MITENQQDNTYTNGVLVERINRVIDVTSREISNDIETKARAAITSNQAYLDLASPSAAQVAAQVKKLTRQNNALIRKLIGGDLLVENTDT